MRIREIARQNYVRQTGERDAVVLKASAGAKRQIQQEFGSGIVTQILLSIMIKLAIKYIEKWAEENLFSFHVPTNFEEIN